jgi:hypothetical protein
MFGVDEAIAWDAMNRRARLLTGRHPQSKHLCITGLWGHRPSGSMFGVDEAIAWDAMNRRARLLTGRHPRGNVGASPACEDTGPPEAILTDASRCGDTLRRNRRVALLVLPEVHAEPLHEFVVVILSRIWSCEELLSGED